MSLLITYYIIRQFVTLSRFQNNNTVCSDTAIRGLNKSMSITTRFFFLFFNIPFYEKLLPRLSTTVVNLKTVNYEKRVAQQSLDKYDLQSRDLGFFFQAAGHLLLLQNAAGVVTTAVVQYGFNKPSRKKKVFIIISYSTVLIVL